MQLWRKLRRERGWKVCSESKRGTCLVFWKGAVGEKAEEGKGSERGKEMWGGGRLLLGRARTVTAGTGVRVVRAALEGQGMSDKDFK